MTIPQAALAFMDVVLSFSPEKGAPLHALVAAYPNIPAGTPDFHVYMYFNDTRNPYGGSSWDVRGLWLRSGVLEITTGTGNTDGMTGSDVFERPTDNVEAYVSVLQSDPGNMMGPYFP
jgi:hypothetical protein